MTSSINSDITNFETAVSSTVEPPYGRSCLGTADPILFPDPAATIIEYIFL